MRHPSGEILTATTQPLWSHELNNRWPVESDQTQAVPSFDPVAILVSFGETSTAYT